MRQVFNRRTVTLTLNKRYRSFLEAAERQAVAAAKFRVTEKVRVRKRSTNGWIELSGIQCTRRQASAQLISRHADGNLAAAIRQANQWYQPGELTHRNTTDAQARTIQLRTQRNSDGRSRCVHSIL